MWGSSLHEKSVGFSVADPHRRNSTAIPSDSPRLKPVEWVLMEPLGLKAELPRINAGAPTGLG